MATQDERGRPSAVRGQSSARVTTSAAAVHTANLCSRSPRRQLGHGGHALVGEDGEHGERGERQDRRPHQAPQSTSASPAGAEDVLERPRRHDADRHQRQALEAVRGPGR
jgi:hypothetical protein